MLSLNKSQAVKSIFQSVDRRVIRTALKNNSYTVNLDLLRFGKTNGSEKYKEKEQEDRVFPHQALPAFDVKVCMQRNSVNVRHELDAPDWPLSVPPNKTRLRGAPPPTCAMSKRFPVSG